MFIYKIKSCTFNVTPLYLSLLVAKDTYVNKGDDSIICLMSTFNILMISPLLNGSF